MPIQSVIEADFLAADSAIKLISKYGFENGQLRMVEFTYTFVDDGREKNMTVKIPFLSLIPLPLLEIKDAEFRFGMQILDQVEEQRVINERGEIETQNSQVFALLAPPVEDKMEEKSTSQISSSFEANMDVRVRVGRSPLPAGLQQLLNLSQEAIQGTENTRYLEASPNSLHFSKSEPTQHLEIEASSKTDDPLPDDLAVIISIRSIPTTSEIPFEVSQILKGELVGTDNFPLKVHPLEHQIELDLTANTFALDRSGWLKVTCPKAKPLKIYFKIQGETDE